MKSTGIVESLHCTPEINILYVNYTGIYLFIYLFIFKDFIYFFVREREWQSGRQRQKEKQAPCRARSPMRDSIPESWDHDLT